MGMVNFGGMIVMLLFWVVGLYIFYIVIKKAIDNSDVNQRLKSIQREVAQIKEAIKSTKGSETDQNH